MAGAFAALPEAWGRAVQELRLHMQTLILKLYFPKMESFHKV